MLNLIKLELKRVSLKSHFIGLLAANIVIALLSAFTSSLLNAGGGVAVTGLPPAQLDTLTLAIMLVRAALIVWEAVLISVFVVEEYRNKTINLLFTYPVQRGKLIAVKIILICGVMLLFHVLSGVFQFTCLSVVSKYFPFVTVSPKSNDTSCHSIVVCFAGPAPTLHRHDKEVHDCDHRFIFCYRRHRFQFPGQRRRADVHSDCGYRVWCDRRGLFRNHRPQNGFF